jgi:enoyl-[acyl-carrier protein] reductase II
MALVPQVVDAVDIPVLAAGGIFDGRGAAAAFLLGACGVQVGTRFLVADECRVHDTYKERLIKASDVGTMVTGKSLGDAVRSLKTPFSKKFARLEADSAVPDDEVRAFGAGAFRKAVFEGDLAAGCFLAGEAAGLVCRRETAADIVNDIIGGAERLLAAAPGLLT